ncbi:hypothetical protein [Chryseobacterium sp.]|uniref:hypothetical protein n=1 Tax=Chryseobacterium sp. TaxID=1871047 RepID=UPI00289A6B02|nr:hypothetical protein [Chryseobacterium sp.]
MKHYLAVVLLIFLLISCKNSTETNPKITNNQFHFIEIGLTEIKTTKFPTQWNVGSYDESPSISKEDIDLEQKLNDLDYFDSIKGKSLKSKIYDSLLKESNQKIDSVFIIDSLSNKNTSFIYVKSFKTLNDNSYEFPPKIHEIDILVFSKSKFKKKINIYSDKNFPFFVDLKLGYLDKKGNLYIRQFETDEESTKFIREEHFSISENGNTKLISSQIIKQKESPLNNDNFKPKEWKGFYEITTKAISEYNNQEIDLLYSITVKSNNAAILSIGAEYSEDYWCEGNYNLSIDKNILYAKGKCDEDDTNDFYLKFENGKYYIKSKRFLNSDWQELKKT